LLPRLLVRCFLQLCFFLRYFLRLTWIVGLYLLIIVVWVVGRLRLILARWGILIVVLAVIGRTDRMMFGVWFGVSLLRRRLIFLEVGGGRAAFGVLGYGVADDFAPVAAGVGVDLFVLGDGDRLGEELGEIDESFGHTRLDVTANDCGEKTG
jgi:hypothetical protein